MLSANSLKNCFKTKNKFISEFFKNTVLSPKAEFSVLFYGA